MAQKNGRKRGRHFGRTTVVIAAVVLAIIVAGVLAAPSLINWNSFKPQLATAVRDATGKDLRIDGDITVSLLPRAELSVNGIRLLDTGRPASAELLSVAEISATVRVWPLLARRLVVDELVISDPVLTLAVDRDGRQNWAVGPSPETTPPEVAEADSGSGLIRDIFLADVRIVGGRVTYDDLRTGQSFQANDIAVTAALPEPGNAATIAGKLRLNDEPATVTVSGEAPGRILAGEQLDIEALLESRLLRAHYAGNLQNKPAPAADGAVEIDTTSLAALADWLGAPVPQLQPDPGPLMLRARFAADSSVVDLQELVIQGDGVDALVNGRFDHGAATPALRIDVQGGLVDVDHYLTLAQADRPPPTAPDNTVAAPDLLALLPDAPLDLSPLQAVDAAIQVQLGGVRAAGFEFGPIDLAVGLVSGVATAEIAEIGLYGGTVRGRVVLDGGSGEALAVETDLTFDDVTVDQLAGAVLDGTPISGVAAGTLVATARGVSPRALVAGAAGNLTLGLRDPLVSAVPGTIGDIRIVVDLPGPAQNPKVTTELVYNGEPAIVGLSLSPLDQILSGDGFAVTVSVDSRLAQASYDGRVALAPLTTEGAITADVASVADLATWLELPLGGLVEDPGPLTLRTQVRVDAAATVASFANLTVDSAFADLRGRGQFDGQGPVPSLALDLASDRVALERLLATPDPAATSEPPPSSVGADNGAPATLPDTPLDLAVLHQFDADIRLRIGQLSTDAIAAGPIDLALAVNSGVASVTITELGLGGGTFSGSATLDGASAIPALSGELALTGLTLDALVPDAPVSGLTNGSLAVTSEGASVQALVANLIGKAEFALDEVDVRDERVGTVADVSLSLDLPGPAAPPQLDAAVTYNGEPVTLAVTLDPLAQITSGDPLNVAATIGSRLINAQFDGALRLTPALGVQGALDVNIGSVADLSKWLGQPLKLPSDPGALAVKARFVADAAAVTLDLEEFVVAAQGLDARVTGRVDASGPVPNITLDVQGGIIDLDRFLPPAGGVEGGPDEPSSSNTGTKDLSGLREDKGWSDTPLALTSLREFQGEAHIEIASLLFHDLDLRGGVANVVLQDAVLVGELASEVADGEMSGTLTVDASRDAVELSYTATASGVQARPVLRSLGATDRLSGTVTLAAQGTAKGRSQRELFESLDGTGEFRFLDGAIHGINLAAALRRARSLGLEASTGEAQKTDFAELTGSFVITDGIVANNDLTMLAPLIRVNGNGLVSLPPQTLDYQVEAKLVASLEGQGGDTALAGLPIPVSIAGPWAQLTYGVDWQNVLQAVALDPARLSHLPDDLRQLGTSLGVALPRGESVNVGDVVEGVTGLLRGRAAPTAAQKDEPAPLEGVASILKELVAPGSTATESPDQPVGPDAEPDPVRVLRGLFGN